MFDSLKEEMAITSFRNEYHFLSNFYEYPILYNNVLYKSTEHAFQAQKTLDLEEIQLVRNASTPGRAKKLGKEVTLREDWEDIKVDVMRDILWAKFSNTDLSTKLLSTGERHLIEGNNWHDDFWGMHSHKGKNMLGKLLMEIRDELRNPDPMRIP